VSGVRVVRASDVMVNKRAYHFMIKYNCMMLLKNQEEYNEW